MYILNVAYEWAVLRGDMEMNLVKAIKPELTKKIKRISSKSADEADVVVLIMQKPVRLKRTPLQKRQKLQKKRNSEPAL